MKRSSRLRGILWSFILLSVTANAMSFPRHDPTAPAILSEASAQNAKIGYDLQSILIKHPRPLALINNKFVTEGDIIDNAKVISIRRNAVILDDSTQKITLYLFDQSIQE